MFDGSWFVVGNSALVSLRPEWLVEAERCTWASDGILIGAGAGFRDKGRVVALNGDGNVGVNALTFSAKQRRHTSCSGSIGEGPSSTGSGGRAGLGFDLGGGFGKFRISEARERR